MTEAGQPIEEKDEKKIDAVEGFRLVTRVLVKLDKDDRARVIATINALYGA